MRLFSTTTDTCYETQGFNGNANPYYQSHGLTGHTGIDILCGYGTPIYSDFDGYVYKVLTKENPSNDGTGFTGVFIIVDNGIECFEWLVGHCNPLVQEKTHVTKGQLIGTEANHGIVYSGGEQITYTMQQAGDQRGSHRHVQKRPLIKGSKNRGYILTEHSGMVYKDSNDYSYEYDGTNGVAGCVDPFLPVLGRDMSIGMSGYDVACLQRIFKKEGLADYDATGYFGVKTLASAVFFQKKYNITPALGYIGSKTRLVINHNYF